MGVCASQSRVDELERRVKILENVCAKKSDSIHTIIETEKVEHRLYDVRNSSSDVAVKQIFTNSKTTSEHVLHEIQFLVNLREHPYIVQLIDFIQIEKTFYLVFPLCHGPVMNMRRTEKQAPFTQKRALLYIRQVILALEFLHFHNIIHRDVKPDNILRVAPYKVQLADLGTATLLGQNYNNHGTRAFMAPEIMRGTRRGFAEDVWSLGATLYCFVKGECPFRAKAPEDLSEEICETEPSYQDLDASLVHLLSGMLTKSPSDRLTIAGVKAHPWITLDNTIALPTTEQNCTGENAI